MSSAIHDSLGIVAYLALFAGVGLVFVFANLLIGRFLRPSDPHPEKLEIYECGEPAIGSSYVQFDLRFYVVALIFIIFDVEVAFLFPWATVFGKAHHLADSQLVVATTTDDGGATLSQNAVDMYRELGVRQPRANWPREGAAATLDGYVKHGARKLGALATIEVIVFFVVLLIGFAYVWRQGALDWVRALTSQQRANPPPHRRDGTRKSGPSRPVLSA